MYYYNFIDLAKPINAKVSPILSNVTDASVFQ